MTCITPIRAAATDPETSEKDRAHYRLEWLKRVLAADLHLRAKALAGALAVVFANDETGQCNPSIKTLCDSLNMTEDTVRRGINDLVEAGLLLRVIGRGRGRKSGYLFLPSANVVPIRQAAAPSKAEKVAATEARKRSHGCDLSEPAKGGTAAPKRSHGCGSLYKDEHTMEHTEGGAAEADAKTLAAFEDWWSVYPKPRNRARSARLFCDAVAAGVDPVWIIASARRYRDANESKGTPRGYIAGGDTWLDRRGWEDHPPPALAAPAASTEDALDAAAQLWGKVITEGRYVPPSAVTAHLARVILAKGYATEAQMLAKGIRP